MLEIVLTLSESDQYSSATKEISKSPLMYMTGYFCRSVYKRSVGLLQPCNIGYTYFAGFGPDYDSSW